MFRYLLLLMFLFAAYILFAQSDSFLTKHKSDSLIKLTVVGNGKYRYIAYTDVVRHGRKRFKTQGKTLLTDL